MSVSPAEFTNQEMNRVVMMSGQDKVYPYSRQSSMGASEEDYNTSEQKMSRRLITLKMKPMKLVQPKEQISVITKIVQNIYFQIFITLLTLVSLVLYDLKTIFMSKDRDFDVGVANIVLFGIFMIEILMNIKTEGYFCSFYFYLDLISTITLLLDVDFITDALFNQSSSSNFQINSLIAKSKASRAAARAVRVVKIFRLARVAKLYKSTQRARELNEKRKKQAVPSNFPKKNPLESTENKYGANFGQASEMILVQKQTFKSGEENILNRDYMQKDTIKEQLESHNQKAIGNEIIASQKLDPLREKNRIDSSLGDGSTRQPERFQLEQIEKKQSHISKILSDDTIKRIIIIILILMVSIPLMDMNNYVTLTTHWDFMTSCVLKMLYNKNIQFSQINSLIQKNVQSFASSSTYSEILCFETPFEEISLCPNSDFSAFRTSDLGMFYAPVNVSQILQIRPELNQKTSILVDQSQDEIVIFVNYSSYNRIDAVFSIVTTLFICLTIMYLLTSFSNNINELIISPIEKMLELVKAKDVNDINNQTDGDDGKQQYETQMVQQAIIKIKNLMETIFGPLGNELIQEKMQNREPIKENLDKSVNKMLCAFVYCKINHIETIAEVLGEDIFGFANEISLIVQNAAFRYGGYCTKIMDNGFLLAFKIPTEQLVLNKVEEQMDPRLLSRQVGAEENTYIKISSDFAVFSALKILVRLCKEPKIFKYRNDQRLLVSFKGSFNVEMSFALTLGWASQGIVGSSYKIEPFFFGPEMGRLNNLMKFCKNKGNYIVVAESLYANLTAGMKAYCRGLQSIRFQDCDESEKVYTVDFDNVNVTPSRKGIDKARKQLKQKKEQNMGFLQEGEMTNYKADEFINSKKELRQILKRSLSRETIRKYKLAFQLYVKGEWTECLQLLQYQKLNKDFSAQRLKAFIKHYNCIPPGDWKGYRQFESVFENK